MSLTTFTVISNNGQVRDINFCFSSTCKMRFVIWSCVFHNRRFGDVVISWCKLAIMHPNNSCSSQHNDLLRHMNVLSS